MKGVFEQAGSSDPATQAPVIGDEKVSLELRSSHPPSGSPWSDNTQV